MRSFVRVTPWAFVAMMVGCGVEPVEQELVETHQGLAGAVTVSGCFSRRDSPYEESQTEAVQRAVRWARTLARSKPFGFSQSGAYSRSR